MLQSARRFCASALAITILVGLSSILRGEEPPKFTVKVTIPNMHCAHCAKKIRSQLFTVAGVHSVKTSLKENLAEVYARDGAKLSAYDIWDKLEKAEFTPSKLVMPDKEYTEKPPAPSASSFAIP